jgi:hypothetical protein
VTANITQIKRKRGGQKGNQNARKHGFYSNTLSLAEICRFWNIINLESVDPEIAVLRIKLQSSLHHDPGNRRVLTEASRLLVKWYSTKHRLDRTARNYLKTVIANYFEHYTGVSLGQPVQLTITNNSDKTNRVCFNK